VLVLVGPSWLTARDAQGNRRLDDEADTHRSEIVAALRSDVRVVPVLVGGASMPKASDLPEPLRDLVHRNAAIIEDRRFASDVASLQEALRGLVARDAADGGVADPPGGAATPGRVPPRGRAGPASRGGGPAGPGVPARAGLPALPVGLALAGALLVLVWGVVVQRGWHNEFEAVRVVAGILLVLGTVAGLARRRWRWVAAAGLTGLVGTVLWLLWLLSTHPGEVGEILAPGYDGFANAMALLGAFLVLSAGLLAVRAGPRTNRS
jgi:hypothetical protein